MALNRTQTTSVQKNDGRWLERGGGSRDVRNFLNISFNLTIRSAHRCARPRRVDHSCRGDRHGRHVQRGWTSVGANDGRTTVWERRYMHRDREPFAYWVLMTIGFVVFVYFVINGRHMPLR